MPFFRKPFKLKCVDNSLGGCDLMITKPWTTAEDASAASRMWAVLHRGR